MNDRVITMTHEVQTIGLAERFLITVMILIILVGSGVCLQPECFPTPDQRQLQRVQHAIEERQQNSLLLAREYMNRPAAGTLGIALAGQAAAIAFENETAIELYQKLPRDNGQWEFIAEMGIARRCEILGRLTDAERHLRRALELNPLDVEANSRLGHLLQVAGRNWDGIPYFFTLILQGKCRGDELLGLAAPERFFRGDPQLEFQTFKATVPEPVAQLAQARLLLFENKQSEAERLLHRIIEAAPHLAEAHGRLGRIIYDRGDPAEFLRWRGSLPNDVRHHPEVWFVQGMQARRLGQVEGATRCFLETLTLSPNHLAANIQIAGCLEQMDQPEMAKEFVRQGEVLANLESVLNMLRNDVDPDLMKRTITSLADMGRFWEAAGWTYVMGQIPSVSQEENQKELRHWLQLAMRDLHQNAIGLNPATKLRRTDFAEPRWPQQAAPGTGQTISVDDGISWEFHNDAEKAGIQFRYYEGTTELTRLQHIFNVVGGGLAATDYDLDGWCDLYLAQANNWRDPAPQPDYPDRLFRNTPEGRFVDVTSLAGLGDLGFTHGVCAGDFDQDGFTDLHLGNLGANRLYHNNGDGTFTDVTAKADVAGNEWSTSSTFADFNGDGLPDLYVANYSLLKETAEKICRRANGDQMACTPDLLTAEIHRFYLNLGDGTFRDVTTEAGLRLPNGRGLGLIAWNFGGDGRLGLFVGNDTSPNFLFINGGNGKDGIPSFKEEALIRGVAFDVDGNAQACMGIAAGDANGDGLIDMYITNFFGESDTLYSQRGDGLFDEATRPYDLRDAGFWTLGFGTQFVDFDGDGWEDLVVTNGHVDQQSWRGDPDRTPPQLFRNLQGRKFAEVSPDRLGPFFQQGYLGRGLAKLDWNRDGCVDFAVSHLHGDFALVTNRTPSKGRPLVVRLAGRTGTRDPIGALVKIHCGGRHVFRLVTGGDGYLVTNERFVQFAIPESESEVELEVRWPDGRIERWPNIQPGHDILVIEGRVQPVVLNTFANP